MISKCIKSDSKSSERGSITIKYKFHFIGEIESVSKSHKIFHFNNLKHCNVNIYINT